MAERTSARPRRGGSGLLRALVLLFGAGVGAAGAAVHPRPPANPDPARMHVIYLHGAILTGSDGSAVSPQWGRYEYDAILGRFAREGWEVIGEIRTDDHVESAARRLEGWISELKQAGVPSSHIAVVGASVGGIIAGRVSHRLKDRNITYVLLASLYEMQSLPPVPLSGRVLSIHDEADRRTWVDSEYLVPDEALAASLVVITRTGRGHGLLFTPDDAWVRPTIEWIRSSRAVR